MVKVGLGLGLGLGRLVDTLHGEGLPGARLAVGEDLPMARGTGGVRVRG